MLPLFSHDHNVLTECASRGIAVGSKDDHQALCDFLSDKQVGLKPVLDNVTFSFEDSQAAFDHLWNAKHMGKVVIKL
jgi:D-arabinose 1-dehydrogenase-like Zn-dependent alcohol dehydrogenase